MAWREVASGAGGGRGRGRGSHGVTWAGRGGQEVCRAQGEEARSMAHLLAPAAALPRVQRVWEESDHGCRRHRRGRGVGGVVTRAEHAKRESTVVSRWCPAPLGEGGREAVSEVMRGQKDSGHRCAGKGEQ